MKRDLYQKYFKDKKATVMGLGLLGRGTGDAEFLAKNCRELIITDLKSSEQLQSSIDKLSLYHNIRYTLGQQKMEDFEKVDFVLKASSVPLDSEYIEHARENNIDIFMSAALVTKIIYESLPNVKVIGITGTRGKTTTTKLIYHIINNYIKLINSQTSKNVRVHLGGNIRGLANLPLLEAIEDGDYIVMELDSWQLQGYGDLKISPKISVFTNFMSDHMNYYKNNMEAYFNDKANIFKYQKDNDVLITNDKLAEKIKSILTKLNLIVPDYYYNFNKNNYYESKLIGEHNQASISLATEACLELGIDNELILESVKTFEAEEGRLQYLGDTYGIYKNIIVYNDNNATTGEAGAAAINSVAKHYRVSPLVILGGKSKGLDLYNLINAILVNKINDLILLEGSGTEEFIFLLDAHGIKYSLFGTLSECVEFSFQKLDQAQNNYNYEKNAKQIILFTPSFASFSHEFNNEYERNDEFLRCVSVHK